MADDTTALAAEIRALTTAEKLRLAAEFAGAGLVALARSAAALALEELDAAIAARQRKEADRG